MEFLFIFPFLLQGFCMMFDEFVFHRRRGLPLWEIIGHPIDTFSVLLVFMIVILTSFNPMNLVIFVILAFISCILVTKDEFVHHEKCSAREQWLHALLFILHPITFMSCGYIWYLQSTPPSLWPTMFQNINLDVLVMGVKIQLLIVISFLIYQILYWGFLWKPKKI